MASVDVENLTDGEIRAKFMELGSPVGPVTVTTRKILLKKLKTLLEQNESSSDLNSTKKYDPRSIPQSSEDESDTSISRTRSNRRSMPPPKLNKSPRRKSPSRVTLGNEPLASSTFSEQSSVTSIKKDTVNSYASPTINTYETRMSTRNSLNSNNSINNSNFYSENNEESDDDTSFNKTSKRLQTQGSMENKVTDSSSTHSPDLWYGLSDAFKSRLQGSGPSYTSPTNYTSPKLNTSNQPYASDFLRRLSANKSPGKMFTLFLYYFVL